MCVCVSLPRPGQRTGDDLEIIYDELLHIKALAHLSNTVSQKEAPLLFLKAQYRFNSPEPHGPVFFFVSLRVEGEVGVTVDDPLTGVKGKALATWRRSPIFTGSTSDFPAKL